MKQENKKNKPMISIGIPIYNGEKLIKKKIESLLDHALENFEIIISDNGSIDSTAEICSNIASKNNNIHFYPQKKNHGSPWNFNFVLQKAKGEFFTWAAVDDIILPGFFEKNIAILKTHHDIVCSSSQVEICGYKKRLNIENKSNFVKKKVVKKIRKRYGKIKNYPATFDLEKNFRCYLKLRGHQHIFYGVFRTEQLKKLFVTENITGFDLATLLNGLKYGKYFVLEEVLAYRGEGGISSRGIFNYAKLFRLSKFETIFLYYPLTKWCFNNFGLKIFLKNFDSFIVLNFEVLLFLVVDTYRKLRGKG